LIKAYLRDLRRRARAEEMLAACPERGTAAELCANYSLNGVGGQFLPSRDELALMYRNSDLAESESSLPQQVE
jgi:hypothetical protein